MNAVDGFIARVTGAVPPPLRAALPIAEDVRAHLAERVAHGATDAEAVLAFGDPLALAASYLQDEALRAPNHAPRLLAKLIDIGAVLVATALLALIANFASAQRYTEVIVIAGLVIASVALPTYTAVAECRSAQTVGKRWMRLAVVQENGTRISIAQSCVRQLPLLVQLVFIDAAFALFNGNRQRAVELLSKTRVIALTHAP